MFQVKVLGQMDNTVDNTLESANRVYDSNAVSPTIPTCCGGGHQPKVLEINCVAMRGQGENNMQQLEINSEDISNSITTVQKDNLVLIRKETDLLQDWVWEIQGQKYLIRIRKLTPRECWRLMDFSDEDFEKAQAVNSNTQLYKQAGNSIVKNVLCEVFRQLIEREETNVREPHCKADE